MHTRSRRLLSKTDPGSPVPESKGLALPSRWPHPSKGANIGKPFATREDLSLKKGPDSERPARAKVRVGVFNQLDYFLFADYPDSIGIELPRIGRDGFISTAC